MGRVQRTLAAVTTLQAAEPHEEEQHEGTDDRPDDAHRVEAVNAHFAALDEVLQESADEGAEDDRARNSDGVPAGPKQAGDQPCD